MSVDVSEGGRTGPCAISVSVVCYPGGEAVGPGEAGFPQYT